MVVLALFIDSAFRRRWQKAFGVAAGVAAVVAVEHAYYLAVAGDLLFRPHAMARHNLGMLTNPNEIIDNLGFRLFKAYPRMMLVPNKDFGLHSLSVLIFAGLALALFRRDRRIYLLLLWAMIPWLYLNFGTSSLTQYIVLPVAPRYIEFVYPPLILAAAWLLSELRSRSELATWAVAPGIAIVLVTGVICGLATRTTGYRTGQVAVLRVITDTFVRQGIQCARFERDRNDTWGWGNRTLSVLSGDKLQECTDHMDGPTIGVDQFGLPHVVLKAPGTSL